MEESALRLLLIIVGLFVLFGIYFYDKIKKRPKQSDDFIEEALKVQPVIIDEETDDVSYQQEAEVNRDQDDVDEPFVANTVDPVDSRIEHATIPVAEESPVIQLLVIPNQGKQIDGVALLNVFTALNLEFGDMGIFHRYSRQQGVETKLFHVANMLEPGTFPVGNMGEFETKGIVLFFQASQSTNPGTSFDDMLESAREISQQFDCQLLNSDMAELTFEKIDEIRNRLSNLSN